ncbi:Agglutinin receptor [Frankliniella fusca]|uniref:Agglutinin receptor n=1 Tax=Frankliniella fusca TaxID=407009 RepID=A0AAE1H7W3_9NEOP|nr:Agglutinin receptor [Frankliniella fusca]
MLYLALHSFPYPVLYFGTGSLTVNKAQCSMSDFQWRMRTTTSDFSDVPEGGWPPMTGPSSGVPALPTSECFPCPRPRPQQRPRDAAGGASSTPSDRWRRTVPDAGRWDLNTPPAAPPPSPCPSPVTSPAIASPIGSAIGVPLATSTPVKAATSPAAAPSGLLPPTGPEGEARAPEARTLPSTAVQEPPGRGASPTASSYSLTSLQAASPTVSFSMDVAGGSSGTPRHVRFGSERIAMFSASDTSLDSDDPAGPTSAAAGPSSSLEEFVNVDDSLPEPRPIGLSEDAGYGSVIKQSVATTGTETEGSQFLQQAVQTETQEPTPPPPPPPPAAPLPPVPDQQGQPPPALPQAQAGQALQPDPAAPAPALAPAPSPAAVTMDQQQSSWPLPPAYCLTSTTAASQFAAPSTFWVFWITAALFILGRYPGDILGENFIRNENMASELLYDT